MIQVCDQRGDHILTAKLLLFAAKIHRAAGDATSALPHVLRCLSLCRDLNLRTMLCEAALALASLHLSMGSPKQALECIEKHMPHILENAAATVKADSYLIIAKCLLGNNEAFTSEGGEKGEKMEIESEAQLNSTFPQSSSNLVVKNLLECLKHATPVNYRNALREAHYLLARIYHEMGDTENRNASAAHFATLVESAS